MLTAKEAKVISDTKNNSKMEKIMQDIETAANKGNYLLYLTYAIRSCDVEFLQNKGYKVTVDKGSYRDSPYTYIDWGDRY